MAPLLPCPPANSSHPPPPPPSFPTRLQPSKALSTADLEAAGQLLLPLPPEVTVAYNKDPSPVKVNLGVGAYRTEEGKPLVLNVVRRAEQMLINNPSRVKEYLPITGLAEFNKLSAKLIFGAEDPPEGTQERP